MMGRKPLLLALEAMQVERIRFTPDAIQIDLVSTAASCNCPECGQRGSRVHSRYSRRLDDLPAHGRIIQLKLNLRRFFCDHPDCPKETFVEPLPKVTRPHARRTTRLTVAMQGIAFTSGGEAGARLARDLGMRTSPDTLLRLMRNAPPAAVQLKAPQVLGVDDWAIRRGCRYGTILCDLQLHKPIELLPERSSQCLANWLVDHPGTHIISRDRGGDYARGAAAGAPQAIQVADRWHLLHNLTEAFQRALDRRHVLITQAAAKAVAQAAVLPVPTLAPAESVTRLPSGPSQPTRAQQLHEQRRARRLARYEEVRKLHAQGVSLRQIAVELKLDRDTVRRFVCAGQFPERARRAKPPTELDRFMDYLRLRWQQGCHSSKQLYRKLKDRGYGGSWYTMRRRVSAWRQPKQATHVPGRRPVQSGSRIWRPSSRTVAWLLLDPVRAESTQQQQQQQQAFLAELHRLWPELGETVALIHEFRRLLRERQHESLDAWVQLAQEKSIPVEITSFARHLQKDWAAVVEAVKGVWSNGQVEGQINRLKLIKRQMYGRANFDLLRQRVLHAS